MNNNYRNVVPALRLPSPVFRALYPSPASSLLSASLAIKPSSLSLPTTPSKPANDVRTSATSLMSSASAPAIPVKRRRENVVVVHGADADAYKRLAAKKSPHNMQSTQAAQAVRFENEGAEAASMLAAPTVALASSSPAAYRPRAVSDLRKLFDVPAPIPAPPSLKPPQVLAQRPPRPTANVSAPLEATVKHTVAPQGAAPTEECLKENRDRNARPEPAAFAAEPGLDQHHPQPRREQTEQTQRVVKRTSKLPRPSTSSPRR
jgi:hypothetical protein